MASKDGVGDGTKTPSEIDKEDIEAWTSRQIEYHAHIMSMVWF